ncbi:hypothetical protein Tco_1236859 [Tanacetum coccineum]
MSSMRELTFFLGLQVMQNDDRIFISQDKYVADILKKFNLVTVKTTSTPIKTNKALLKDEEAKDVDVHLYRSMIESLIYLTAYRPDIMFAVCACARFQVTPKVSHLHVVKRIFRYLKGQPKLGLWYPMDSPFDLDTFSDSDYAGASLDRKSTTGGCQFLGKRLISWQCKKQTIVANSTTEAEYVAAANCCGQVLWIQNQMLDYGFNFMNTKIHIDNESTICIVKNPVFHSKTKHIEIRHHFIRDSYEKKLIQVIKIHTDHNVADLLTKAFDVSSGPIHLVVDETVYKEWEDRMERAATTAFSFEAEQGTSSGSGLRCQDTILGGAEAQTRFEAASKQSNDPPLSRVNTLGSGEDSMKLMELMEHCTTLFELFWATAKVNTVNEERQLQALVDKKNVIITETSIRSDLNLEDAGGIDCLTTATIFEELARMGAKTTAWNEFSSTMASTIICLDTNQKINLSKYIFDAMTPIISQPSSSKPQKKKSRRKPRKESVPTEPTAEATPDEAHVSTSSCDPPQSGEDIMKLIELMNLCTQLQSRVLTLETTKSNQALEIKSLKKIVKSLEKRKKLRTSGFKRLMKGRKIADLDADAEVTLVDETQEINDDNLMFDIGVLEEQEKDVAEKEVSAADLVTTAGEVVTTANVEVTTVNAPTTTIDELTLAQTLIEIKATKPKAVTSAATTTTTTRPKAREDKDKGKGIMVDPKVPLKKKDQIAMDEEITRNLKAQLQAELEEEERISRLKEEKANIALLESWDNTQAMMDPDFQLAQQMQTEEQE